MRGQRGFTLIELLVVIIVVGILAAIGAPIYRGYVDHAAFSEPVSVLGSLKTGVVAVTLKRGALPETLPGPQLGAVLGVIPPNSIGAGAGPKWLYAGLNAAPVYSLTATGGGAGDIGEFLAGKFVRLSGSYDPATGWQWTWTASAGIDPSWLPQ